MGTLTLLYLVLFFFGFFFIFIFLILHHRNKDLLYKSPKITKYYSISFLVPAYNEEKTIKETIDALVNLDYPKNKKEIIIINDGSKDKTLDIARELEKKYSFVKILDKKNSGKANSLNEALKIAKGEIIAVVDADSYPEKYSVKKMVGHFDDLTVGAVTSRVLVKNKKNWLEKFQIMDYSIIAWTRKLLDFVDSVYVTNGPLSMYRKSEAIKLGGFDPNNLTEDIEITWHFLSKGYKTRMSYNAIVYTNVPDKLGYWIKQRVRWNLGGIQTIQKYWKTMFLNPGKNMFGYFVVPYVTSAFIFALIGFSLILRYFWIKGNYYFFSIYYAFQGYDYFNHLQFELYLSVLIIFSGIFLIISLYYYRLGFKNSETGKKNIFKILGYTFIYRPLYIVPLIIAIYKLVRGDIQWYTK